MSAVVVMIQSHAPSDDALAEDIAQHVRAGRRGQALHGHVTRARDLEDPPPILFADANLVNFLQVLGVERVGHAQERRQLVDTDSFIATQARVRGVRLLREAAAMIAGDVADELHVVAGQAENLRGLQEIKAVFVVASQVHELADIVQKPGNFQQKPVAFLECVLGGKAVEQLDGQSRDSSCVRLINVISGTEPGGAGQDLRAEVSQTGFCRHRSCELDQQSGTQRDVGNDDARRGGREKKAAIDEQGRHECRSVDLRQTKSIDESLFVTRFDFRADGKKRLAWDFPNPLLVGLDRLAGGKSHVAPESNHVRDPAQRGFEDEVADDVRDLLRQQPNALLVRAVPGRQPLAKTDGSERVDAGLRRLSALEKRQTDTAAADFDEGGVGDVEHGVVLQAISNGQVGEPALLGSVDDFDIQAGTHADPIEERVCIGRFAHGAGCHGTDVAHLIAVHDVAKAVQRANGGIDRRRPDPADREGVLAEE